MLRTLLEDRRHLRVHRETKETSVAALLKESESERRHRDFDTGKLQEIYSGFTMKDVAEHFAQADNGTIDRTALPSL